MNGFYVMNSKSLKQGAIILVASFFTAWLIYVGDLVQVPVFSTTDGPKAVYQGEKDIALTFNIGWGDEKAGPILEELKKQNVRTATFFLAGSWAERHPELVARIQKDGYEIGILGYSYLDYSEAEDSAIRKDLSKAQEAFKKLNVKGIKVVRAPTGHFDKRALSIAEKYGLTIVHWSIDSKDWTNPGVQKIIQNVEGAGKGDIILLHASDSAKQTVQALPQITDNLKKRGLKFVTVTEMIANGESRSEEIH